MTEPTKDRINRCHDFLMSAVLGYSVNWTMASKLATFILAETGRNQPELADKTALVLYFDTEQEATELVEAIREAKPGMITRAVVTPPNKRV